MSDYCLSFAGNSDPSLYVREFTRRRGNLSNINLMMKCISYRNCNSRISVAGVASTGHTCKTWSSSLKKRGRRPRFFHRRWSIGKCQNAWLWGALSYQTRNDWELGSHGKVLGTDDLQISESRTRRSLFPLGAQTLFFPLGMDCDLCQRVDRTSTQSSRE